MASLLKLVAYSSVQPSTAIPECTMAWRTEGSMRAFSPHSHAGPLKSLAQPDGKEGHDLFQESNPRAAKLWKMLISPLCQWVSKQSLFSKINWIHKKYYPQQTSSGSQIIHQAIQLVTTETLRVISRNLCQITKAVGLKLQAKGGITVTHYCITAEQPKQSTCNPCWFSKFLCVTLGQKSEQILTLLIGKATGKNITRSTRTTGAIAAPTANPNLEQIAWGAI
jgi:hypothetical protein